MSSINDDLFVIQDFAGFVESTRALVFNNFGSWDKDTNNVDSMIIKPEDESELDRLLSQSESEVIIKQFVRKQKHKSNGTFRYLINDSIFMEIVQGLNDRMVSNVLTGLVNKGLVESAYDSDINDFVFWVKDETKDEKPETD